MSLPSGTYKLTNVSLNLPLTPKGHAVNAEIVALPDDMTDMFKWKIVHISGDTYSITNMASDLFCYVGPDVSPPANLIVSPNTQEWNLIPVPKFPDAYTIAAADNNMYWSLSSMESGANVMYSKTGGGRLQQWIIEAAKIFLPSGNYKIKNLMLNLPIKPGTGDLNGAVIATADDHSDDFKWTITHITGGICTIQTVKNGFYLHAGTGLQSGVTVTLRKEKQYIEMMPITEGYSWWMVACENDKHAFLGVDSYLPDAKLVTADGRTLSTMGGKTDAFQWNFKKA